MPALKRSLNRSSELSYILNTKDLLALLTSSNYIEQENQLGATASTKLGLPASANYPGLSFRKYNYGSGVRGHR